MSELKSEDPDTLIAAAAESSAALNQRNHAFDRWLKISVARLRVS